MYPSSEIKLDIYDEKYTERNGIFFHQNGHHEGKGLLSIINSKVDKLRDDLINRRKRNIFIESTRRTQVVDGRKARKAAVLKSKIENIKHVCNIELTENQKWALSLGQGFVVRKSFNLG